MDMNQRIQALIEPALETLGYEVVLVRLTGSLRPALKITIDRLDHEGVGIEDCVSASREISAVLDVEDPIESAFTLEVSSPGLERPLTKKAHFERFSGSPVKVVTHDPFEGRKRFSGILTGLSGDAIIMDVEEEPAPKTYIIPLSEIAQAKLVDIHAMPSKKPTPKSARKPQE